MEKEGRERYVFLLKINVRLKVLKYLFNSIAYCMEGYTLYARLAIVVYVDQRDKHKSNIRQIICNNYEVLRERPFSYHGKGGKGALCFFVCFFFIVK
jgi:hypothetical protein